MLAIHYNLNSLFPTKVFATTLQKYSLQVETQSQLLATLACLHNFILTHYFFEDNIYNNDDKGIAGLEPDHAHEEHEAAEEMGALHLDHGDAGVMCDNIAQPMYVGWLSEHTPKSPGW